MNRHHCAPKPPGAAAHSLPFAPQQTDAAQATLASYFGHFSHARAQRLRAQAFARHPWMAHCLSASGQGELQRVDHPPLVSSLVSQWSWFRAHYPGHMLLLQVGKRWECSPAAGQSLPAPGSALRRWLGPGRRMARTQPQQNSAFSLPQAQLAAFKRLLTRHALPWCEVAEHGHLKTGLKRRQLAALWPADSPLSTLFTKGVS